MTATAGRGRPDGRERPPDDAPGATPAARAGDAPVGSPARARRAKTAIMQGGDGGERDGGAGNGHGTRRARRASNARRSSCSRASCRPTPRTRPATRRKRRARAARLLREPRPDAELVGELPERQNLIVRLPGARPGPRLGLLGHLDVVPAEASEWSVPPFSGAQRDGYLWGRGATDMKNQVAAQAVAVARLARDGAPFAGELLFIATADEERGDYCGARWLVTHRPELVRCDYLLNEGGGNYSVVRRRAALPPHGRREGLRRLSHNRARPRRSRLGASPRSQPGRTPRPGDHGAGRPRRRGQTLAPHGALHRPPRRRPRPARPAQRRLVGARRRRPSSSPPIPSRPS